MTEVLRVLVVEDEPIAAEAHTAYVGRVDGFEGIVHTAGALQGLAHADDDREPGIDRHGANLRVLQTQAHVVGGP